MGCGYLWPRSAWVTSDRFQLGFDSASLCEPLIQLLKLNIHLSSKIENLSRELACGNKWLIVKAFIVYSYNLYAIAIVIYNFDIGKWLIKNKGEISKNGIWL